MTGYNPENMFSEEPMINMTISESLSFPTLEIQLVSPSFSLYAFTESNVSSSTSLIEIMEDDLRTPTRLTAELLNDHYEPAMFDVNGWGWNGGTVTNNMEMNFITPRQRSFSLIADDQSGPITPLNFTNHREIPRFVPETLPSLCDSNHEGDGEDDYMEAESFFVTSQGLHYEPQIRTINSIPSIAGEAMITPDSGFEAPEAFAEFDEVDIIVAALRLTARDAADENVGVVNEVWFEDEI